MSPRRLIGRGGFVFLLLAIGACQKTSASLPSEQDARVATPAPSDNAPPNPVASFKATLANDQETPEHWVRAARALVKTDRDEGGENLIVYRVQQIADAERPGMLLLAGGKGTNFVYGVQLAKTLREWNDARCDESLDVLERVLVTAHEKTSPISHDARALATARGFLAIADARKEEVRPATWTRMRTLLAKVEPEIFTTYSGPEILSSSIATGDPKMIAWTGEKIATAKIDEHFDHERIAPILTDRRILGAPGAKRRLAALLAEKATQRNDSLRICDRYAKHLEPRGKGKASTPFDVSVSAEDRDAWIAAWLAAGP